MIELRNWQVFSFPPLRAAVVGIPHSAVVAREYDLRICWINPDIVHITVHSTESANHSATLARVLAQNQRTISLEYTVRIFGIDNQVRKVKRAPHHPLTLISLLPGRAAVVRDKERAIGRFHKSVDPFGVR